MTNPKTLTQALAMASALAIAGCTNFYWPQHGHSGVAEERPHMMHWHYDRHQLDHLELAIAEARRDMHVLRHHGLKKHHPALAHDIDMHLIAVEREFEGHFYRDAEINLQKLQSLLEQAYEKMHAHMI